jgi:hypothetical protein
VVVDAGAVESLEGLEEAVDHSQSQCTAATRATSRTERASARRPTWRLVTRTRARGLGGVLVDAKQLGDDRRGALGSPADRYAGHAAMECGSDRWGCDVEADLPPWQLAEDEVAQLLESKGYQIVGRSRTCKGHEYTAVRAARTTVQVKSQDLPPVRSERTQRYFFNGGALDRQVTVYVDTHGPRPWPKLAVPSRWMDDCSAIRTRRFVELGPGRKLSWSGKV